MIVCRRLFGIFITFALIIINVRGTWDMDVKRRFCGSVLSDTISALCKTHNEPYLGYYRRKREVADECCIMPCSKRYLREYYCAEPKALEELTIDTPSNISIKSTETPTNESSQSTQKNKNNTRQVSNDTTDVFSGDPSITLSKLQVRRKNIRRNSRKKVGRNTRNNQKEFAGTRDSYHLTDLVALNEQHEKFNHRMTTARRKHNCTCRKRREKDNRKIYENLKVINRPPPQVGIIEHNSQRPIHVGWFYPSSDRNLIRF